jgi:FKBP-type peptidyl-prolyl cis-trans isomerase FklB
MSLKMLKSKLFSLLVLGFSMITASVASAHSMKTEQDRLSYTLGFATGSAMAKDGVSVSSSGFKHGLEDALKHKQPALTPRQMQSVMRQFTRHHEAKMKTQRALLAEKNLKASAAYMAANAHQPKVTSLPSGLQYRVIHVGHGDKPTLKDKVVVNYEGKLIDGKVFDSSYARGHSATLPLSAVIQGWQQILPLMSKGAEWEVFVPAKLAYGEQGAGALIGPNQALIFKIQLLDIKSA